MIMKYWIFLGLFLLIPCMAQADGFLIINDSRFEEFGPLENELVFFSHDYHADNYKIQCAHCHHVYESGKNVWEEGMPVDECSACHGTNKVELTNAYHMNCWGCHKRLKEIDSNSDAPTVTCESCHIAESEYDAEVARVEKKSKQNSKLIDKFLKSDQVKGFAN